MAEKAMRRLIAETAVPRGARMTVAEAGAVYIEHLEVVMERCARRLRLPEVPPRPLSPDGRPPAGELERHFQATRWRAEDDLVFAHPVTAHVLDASTLRKRWYEALKRAEIQRITFHGLRHTFGTQMAAAGAPIRAIQEWMGHADISTTEIYAH